MISAKEIANEMKIDPKFREKELSVEKKHFEENDVDDNIRSPEELFRIEYFLFMVDQVITSLRTRFEQFKVFENLFGFFVQL